MTEGTSTPYSSIIPLSTELPAAWAPAEEQERVAAYQAYEDLYWSYPKALKISADEGSPIYLPPPRVIVDSTAHFLLKDLEVVPKKAGEVIGDDDPLAAFLKRERFYSRFNTNKKAGVRRGDWIFHLTVNELKAPGTRLSLTPVDPSEYFPIWDDDDIDKLLGVDLVQQYTDSQGNPRIRRLRYTYEFTATGRKVWVEEGIFEVEGWWKGETAKRVLQVIPRYQLPEIIDTIPVFHYPNIEDVGNPFGSSELRGFERVIAGINQSITDEELALALQGLGVYATDAPPPNNPDGTPGQWTIAPAAVMEVNSQGFFKRVDGLGSVTPSQDHLKFLIENLYEGAGVFRTGAVDVQVAESGVALAIKFMPTLAKIEDRDSSGIDFTDQLFYNWARWMAAYEGISNYVGNEPRVVIGAKLPTARTERLNELNNMYDRKIISSAYYRAEMGRLGYEFPENMQEEIIAEQRAWMQLNAEYRQGVEGVQETEDDEGNKSNNANRPNESAGTEAD